MLSFCAVRAFDIRPPDSAAAEYIRKNHRPAGIVMMDFAGSETNRGVSVYGAELVRVLVENNRKRIDSRGIVYLCQMNNLILNRCY